MKDFHHALKIVGDLCIGCSKCMNICPTHAIRVRNGKARLIDNHCIDCGECYRICPVSAIIIEQDDFGEIFDYTIRAALVPAVFYGQFPSKFPVQEIHNALYRLGFTHVVEVEQGVDLIKEAALKLLNKKDSPKPLISAFCPAIVRLIQVKFPALVHNFLLLKPPLDIAALNFRNHLTDQGVDDDTIGIFYITQCAAKIAAIKSPAEEEDSPISGVINMDSIYNKVLSELQNQSLPPATDAAKAVDLAPEEILWSLTTGESDNATGKRMAIDGVHNVIGFLEKLEQEENPTFDFLELRACDESCAGGVLATENRFLAAERLRGRARKATLRNKNSDTDKHEDFYTGKIMNQITIDEIKPRSMMKLDDDMGEAMRKMKMIRQILQMLPQVDCGACGSPGCRALAEDVVQGRAILENCIFIQRRYEQKGMLNPKDSVDILKKVWGSSKFE